jgi:phosphatidate cytidylyltransferase
MFKQRVLTAITLAPLTILGVLLIPPSLFALLIAVLVLVGAKEWSAMMSLPSTNACMLYILLVALVLLLLQMPWAPEPALVHQIASCWWLLAAFLVVSYPRLTVIWRHCWAKGLAGMMVLVPAWSSLVWLRSQPDGHHLLLFLLLLVWGADTGAYFIGKRYGHVKLIPAVSPAKSWAGVGGAVVVVLLISLLIQSLIVWPWNHPMLVYGVAMITLVGAILGDLLESMYKRHCGIKDSGRLLPGHGGVMDRIDSLTAAAPVFAVCLYMLGG